MYTSLDPTRHNESIESMDERESRFRILEQKLKEKEEKLQTLEDSLVEKYKNFDMKVKRTEKRSEEKLNQKRVAKSLSIGYTIKTYEGDFDMLSIFLQSFLISVPSYTFKELVFVLNEEPTAHFKSILPPFSRIYQETLPSHISPLSGHVHQQWTSFYADQYMNSNYIGIFDSDQVFHTTVTSKKIFTKEGKLRVFRFDCDDTTIPQKLDPKLVLNWKRCYKVHQDGAKKLLGIDVKYNYMLNLPFIFPIDILKPLRDHVEKLHQKPFDQVFLDIAKNIDGNEICQICMIGAFMEIYKPERYEFVEHHPTLTEHVGWTTILRENKKEKFGYNYLKYSSQSWMRAYCNRFDVKTGLIPRYCEDFVVPLGQIEKYQFTVPQANYSIGNQIYDYYEYEDAFSIPERPNDNMIIDLIQEKDV